MQAIPWILSESLSDALAQIADLRKRIKDATMYDGGLLTAKVCEAFLAMLDEIERDEVINARLKEEDRVKRAKQRLESAIKQRATALVEMATAIDWLTDGISKLLKSHAAAVDAGREVGTDAPDIRTELQKLAQSITDALKPLSGIV